MLKRGLHLLLVMREKEKKERKKERKKEKKNGNHVYLLVHDDLCPKYLSNYLNASDSTFFVFFFSFFLFHNMFCFIIKR
jgi:hypothetical protein